MSKPVIKVTLEGPSDGAFNMSEDLNLFNQAEKGRAALRVYSWEAGPWVSFGRFQSPRELEEVYAGHRFVRRPTGGAAVRHVDEVTFSLAIPLSYLPFGTAVAQGKNSVRAVYQTVSEAVVYTLVGIYPDARLGAERRRTDGNAPPLDCFEMIDGPDVVDSNGRKLAGSALKVGREAVLLQVSIPIGQTCLTHQSVFARLVDFVRTRWELDTESDILMATDLDRRFLAIHVDWAPFPTLSWEEAIPLYKLAVNDRPFNLDELREELGQLTGLEISSIGEDAKRRMENHFLPGLGASC